MNDRDRTRRVTTSDGVEVAVHEHGDGPIPLLFAHATGLHGLVWQAIAERLADEFHGISFDHRGHGDSGSPSVPDADWRGFGRDVLAVVDGLALARPCGVGHSAGATAMLLAEQSRPGTFRALYCFEPVVIAADPSHGREMSNWLAAGARRRRTDFSSRKEAYATYASKPPFRSWAPDALAAYVNHGFGDNPDGTVSLKCRPAYEALVYESASAYDVFAHLSEVKCPVMLVCGAHSDALGPTMSAAVAGQVPDARTEVMAGLGHMGPLEDPAAVARSIHRFFTSVR